MEQAKNRMIDSDNEQKTEILKKPDIKDVMNVHSLFFIRTRKFQSRLDILKFSLHRASYVLTMFLKCS